MAGRYTGFLILIAQPVSCVQRNMDKLKILPREVWLGRQTLHFEQPRTSDPPRGLQGSMRASALSRLSSAHLRLLQGRNRRLCREIRHALKTSVGCLELCRVPSHFFVSEAPAPSIASLQRSPPQPELLGCCKQKGPKASPTRLGPLSKPVLRQVAMDPD